MRKFLLVPLSVAVLAVLAACASRQPQVVVVPPQQPAPSASTTVVTPPSATAAPAAPAPAVVRTAVLRPGTGRIESMGPAPAVASAGGTVPPAMHRLNIRMDDGTLQVVDTPSSGVSVGDRIELTHEGYIRRFPG
jgi:hypothetical protein